MTHLTVAAAKQAMFPSALEIVQLLDQHIVGQREAKEVLAKSVYRHFMLRAYADETDVEVDTRHKNILLIGPTSCDCLAAKLARYRLNIRSIVHRLLLEPHSQNSAFESRDRPRSRTGDQTGC